MVLHRPINAKHVSLMAVVSPVTRSQGTISMWIFVSLIAEILHNIFALLTILPIFVSLAVVPVSLASIQQPASHV